MSLLSQAQQTAQAASWQRYQEALGSYQESRALDEDYDSEKMDGWIENAASTNALFAANQMKADFDDVDAALSSLEKVTNKAKQYVDSLKSQVNSWNKFATVALAMDHLAAALPGGNVISILSAGNNVAKAYGGNSGT